jgi:inorganic pyrophosphatase
MHLWHDIGAGDSSPEVVNAVIEIPRGSRNKYEVDKALGIVRLDRVLASSVHYFSDYGIIPRTLGEDGDPLDILVLLAEPTFPGCLLEARPIALFRMTDRGQNDEKVLAVTTRDPAHAHWKDLGDVPEHLKREIAHFFAVYKDLEGTRVEPRGWENAAAARAEIVKCARAYEARFGKAAR